MKKVIAALMAAAFALSAAPTVMAQDKGKKEMKKGDGKKTDGKAKAADKKKKS